MEFISCPIPISKKWIIWFRIRYSVFILKSVMKTHSFSNFRSKACVSGGMSKRLSFYTWLAKLDFTVAGIHWSKLASSKMIAGFLPPSSKESFLQYKADLWMICWPVSVLPVKEIRDTAGWETRASPALGPLPNTTFITPGGKPRRQQRRKIT